MTGIENLSCTLNMDECVARGCALQAAMLSPLFKVRDFKVVDKPKFPVSINWTDAGCPQPDGGPERRSRAIVFTKSIMKHRHTGGAVTLRARKSDQCSRNFHQ